MVNAGEVAIDSGELRRANRQSSRDMRRIIRTEIARSHQVVGRVEDRPRNPDLGDTSKLIDESVELTPSAAIPSLTNRLLVPSVKSMQAKRLRVELRRQHAE